MTQLKYLSTATLDQLRVSVRDNLDRYRETGFSDLAKGNSWGLELKKVSVDLDRLSELQGSKAGEHEIENSLIVLDSLPGLTPAMANEERIWARLSHVECVEYVRKRWPLHPVEKEKSGWFRKTKEAKDKSVMDQEDFNQITKHFFAKGRPGVRDDNAISRLWWNAQIANLVEPSNPRAALEQLLKTADIRSNLIERPLLSSRIELLRGIVHFMEVHPEISSSEKGFREFIKSINFNGGGLFFEVMSEHAISQFVTNCASQAKDAGEMPLAS